jgi:hypothetical protein
MDVMPRKNTQIELEQGRVALPAASGASPEGERSVSPAAARLPRRGASAGGLRLGPRRAFPEARGTPG